MNGGENVNRDMVSYYRDRAPEYDRSAYDRWPERQPDLQESARILQEAFAGKSVLEIAAGPGYWTQRIAQTARSITATDVNQSMLDEAQKKRYPEGKVTFKRADLYDLGDLPRHDGLFGGFIFSHILKHDLDKFIDTINGYVVPGGMVALMDNNLTTASDGIDEQGNLLRIRTLEDGSKHQIIKNYPTEQELRILLSNRASKIDFKNLKHFWILMYQTQGR